MKRQERHKRHYGTWILAALLVVAVVWVGYGGYQQENELAGAVRAGEVDPTYVFSLAIQEKSERACQALKDNWVHFSQCRIAVRPLINWTGIGVFPSMTIDEYEQVITPTITYSSPKDCIAATYSAFKNRMLVGTDLAWVQFCDAQKESRQDNLSISSCQEGWKTPRSSGVSMRTFDCCINNDCSMNVSIRAMPYLSDRMLLTIKTALAQPERDQK